MKTKILFIHVGLMTLLGIQSSCTAIAQEYSFSTLPVVGTTTQIDGYPVMSCNLEDLKITTDWLLPPSIH